MNDFETAKQHFLGGLQFLAKNDVRGAESEFTRSLELLPDRVSTLNNLAAVKIKQKQFAEAEKFARRAIALENNSTEAWANLAVAMAETDRLEEALQACDRALQHDSFYARAWLIKAGVLLELKLYDKALIACDHALKLEPGTYDILYIKSQALRWLGHQEEAVKVYMQSFEARATASPILISERRATQKADVLIITPRPIFDNTLQPFDTLLTRCPNFPGQLANYMSDEIHFTYVFMGDAARESAREKIPKPDLLINNYANGELILLEGNMDAMSKLVDSFDVPVVNHPKKAVLSARDTEAILLKGIPGIVVPKTMRFTLVGKSHEEVIKEIGSEFEYPFITRSLTRQMGKGMDLVDSPEKLAEILKIKSAKGTEDNFFVTKFYDSRGPTNYYRKIRASIVDKEIVITRVDFSTHWNVHGRKREDRAQFYLDNSHLLEEEKRVCQDPEAELGRPVMQALLAICDRVPLEVLGIDFDIDREGRVIFYEANATMNLFSTAWHTVPNPKIAADRLKDAFVRYFKSVAKRS